MAMRLSVVIPGYETPDADWRRCLDSVLANVGPDDEVICVDDASPHPAKVPVEYSSRDKRVRLLRLDENGGQAKARNTGLDVATGEYIAFVDSDDEVLPDTYPAAISALTKFESDIVVYGVRTIWDRNGLYKEDVLPSRNMGKIDAEGVAELANACLLYYPWNKVYRKSFLETSRIRFVEQAAPREDEVFNVDCALHDASWCVIDHVGQVYHRQDGTSLSKYRRFGDSANRFVSQRWQMVLDKMGTSPKRDFARQIATQPQLEKAEWQNIWRARSPYSLVGRWRWLRAHPLVGGFGSYIRMLLFSFLRRYFYIRPIRRWHVKRLYPQVQEWRGALKTEIEA